MKNPFFTTEPKSHCPYKWLIAFSLYAILPKWATYPNICKHEQFNLIN